MNTAELLKSYQKVSEATKLTTGEALPALESEGYELTCAEPVVCTSEQQLWSAIGAFGQACGWLAYQSGNQHQLDITIITAKQEYGSLLNAELYNGKDQSMHIRYNGHGGWVVTTYTYKSGGDYVVDEVSYVSSFENKKTLNYLRFWKDGGDKNMLGVNPVFACFTGFGGLDNGTD